MNGWPGYCFFGNNCLISLHFHDFRKPWRKPETVETVGTVSGHRFRRKSWNRYIRFR